MIKGMGSSLCSLFTRCTYPCPRKVPEGLRGLSICGNGYVPEWQQGQNRQLGPQEVEATAEPGGGRGVGSRQSQVAAV
ncbi:hypothetical protein Scep_009480 [Stephania cephalantha]|uniref:Uncharacterized protein n=1 Tax=Stephania cephalantha TaxID=152367 RepID=A0AAP0JTX7_9MAGN